MIIVSVCYVAYVRSSAHISKENFSLILKNANFKYSELKYVICPNGFENHIPIGPLIIRKLLQVSVVHCA